MYTQTRARYVVIGAVGKFTNTAGKTTPKELTWRTMPASRRATLLNAVSLPKHVQDSCTDGLIIHNPQVKKVGKECVTVIHGGEQRDRYEQDWAVEEVSHSLTCFIPPIVFLTRLSPQMTVTILKKLRGSYPYDEYE